jgi:membrane-associated phospholipid phosphatase
LPTKEEDAVRVRKKRTLLFFVMAFAMLLYAVPRLPIGHGWTTETMFGVAWLCMALLIIAAQLYELFGVDDDVEREIQRLKRYKYWRLQQKIVENSTFGRTGH